jgi:hypothetical protein
MGTYQGFRVHKIHDGPLEWEHRWDEALPIAERESNLKTLQQLQILVEKFGRETFVVSKYECHIRLFEDAIVHKALSLWNRNYLCKHVRQPDGVNKVEVV